MSTPIARFPGCDCDNWIFDYITSGEDGSLGHGRGTSGEDRGMARLAGYPTRRLAGHAGRLRVDVCGTCSLGQDRLARPGVPRRHLLRLCPRSQRNRAVRPRRRVRGDTRHGGTRLVVGTAASAWPRCRRGTGGRRDRLGREEERCISPSLADRHEPVRPHSVRTLRFLRHQGAPATAIETGSDRGRHDPSGPTAVVTNRTRPAPPAAAPAAGR